MKRTVAGIFAFAVLLVGAVFFAAEESYVLNITAELQPKPEVLTKHVVKDPSTVLSEAEANEFINELIKAADPPNSLDVVFPCVPGETSPPKAHIKTCTYWVMRITVTNIFEPGVHMDDVLVRDIFSGEFLGVALDNVPMEVLILKTPRGQAANVHSGPSASNPWPKIELFWCVTGTLKVGDFDGDGVEEGQCNQITDPIDDEDQLKPGESQTLEILVFTRLNPHGLALAKDDPRRGNFQEFTSPCAEDPKDLCYTLNSGARAYWVDRKTPLPGQCHPLADCPSTDPIFVGTIANLNSVTLNTPINFGTVHPGEELREQFELSLSSTFLADGTDGTLTYRIFVVPGTPNDISPYIKIVREESEGPEAADAISFASLSEPSDLSDVWWVIFTVPDCADLPDPPLCEAAGVDLSADLAIVLDAPDAALPP